VKVSYDPSPASLPLSLESISSPPAAPSPTYNPAPTSTPTPVLESSTGTFYVAKNGNDNNPGTESEPWLTITKAANTLVSGETVYVKGGTYNEQVTVKNSGREGKYITFSAYPGDTVTVDGNGREMEDWSGIFWIKGKYFITVSGFDLKNGRNGVDVNGGSNIIIKDNYIENPYHTGIKVGWESSSNIVIDGNSIKKNKGSEWNEMISISNGHNVEVKNNHVMENVIGEGIDMKDGTSDSTIHHNIVEKASSAGVYIDGYEAGVSNIEVYKNTVSDSDTGFSTGSERGGLAQNIFFHDNTAYNTNTGYKISYWTESGEAHYKNIDFSNNIAYNNQVDYSGI
jgi:hypothetical protein